MFLNSNWILLLMVNNQDNFIIVKHIIIQFCRNQILSIEMMSLQRTIFRTTA